MNKIPTLGTGETLTPDDKLALRKQMKAQLAVQLIGNILSNGLPYLDGAIMSGKAIFDYSMSIADSVDSYAHPPEVSRIALDS